MVMMSWAKCTTRTWCRLVNLDLSAVYQEGVYIIWVPRERVIRVGQGDINERLRDHKDNDEILSYGSPNNPLLVTCGDLEHELWNGVERYLANTLDPVLGIYPNAMPIPVNLPLWGMSSPQ